MNINIKNIEGSKYMYTHSKPNNDSKLLIWVANI